MKQSDLEKFLKLYNPLPSKKWQDNTLKSFQFLEKNVTDRKVKRNSELKIFNLLSLPYMSTKLKVLLATVTIVSLVLIGGGGAVFASDSAVPGDLLYPLDKAAEEIQRIFTFGVVNKTKLEMNIMDERVEELNQVSKKNNSGLVSDALIEIEEQQTRLQDRLQEMDQLRTQDKLQTQDQQKLMQQLQEQIQNNEELMNQVQNKLKENNDDSNSNELEKIQNKYVEQNGSAIQNFEDSTGIQIQENESEQNSGDETQIQNENQNQTQNQGTTTPENENSGNGKENE